MSIRRISDLSNILLYKKDDAYYNYSVSEGVTRDVLGGKPSRSAGGSETDQLLNSMMEISWRRDNDPTKYDSKSISYDTLCAYITHNIQCEDYDFYGNKTLNGDLTISGNVNISGDNFNVQSKNVNISGDVVTVDGRETYIYGHDRINISVITEEGKPQPTIGLSGDNIAINGRKSFKLIYDDTMEIIWNNNGTLVPVMTFGNDKEKPTVKVHMDDSFVGTTENPVDGTSKYALWA